MKVIFTKTSLIILVAYIITVTGCVFATRPTDIPLPSFTFFLIFCSLPCISSSFPALSSHSKATQQKIMYFIAAIALFMTTWLIQLWLLAQYAATQPSKQIEGLLSNFYVFSHVFLVRGLMTASAALVLVITLGHLVARRHDKD
jgi:hypothetical protein